MEKQTKGKSLYTLAHTQYTCPYFIRISIPKIKVRFLPRLSEVDGMDRDREGGCDRQAATVAACKVTGTCAAEETCARGHAHVRLTGGGSDAAWDTLARSHHRPHYTRKKHAPLRPRLRPRSGDFKLPSGYDGRVSVLNPSSNEHIS